MSIKGCKDTAFMLQYNCSHIKILLQVIAALLFILTYLSFSFIAFVSLVNCVARLSL